MKPIPKRLTPMQAWVKARTERTISTPRHFALAGPAPVPARKRARPIFNPALIDSELYIIDPIRPYPEWPLICKKANLPARDTEKEIKDWNEKNGHAPILKIWKCEFCAKFHAWGTSHTDNNGRFKAGADRIPKHIQKLIDESR